MVWLRNKYGGWFEIPDEDYKPSGEKMGQSALHAAKIGTRVVDGNGNIWRKTSDDLPWHNEKNDDKASDYALAQLKEYKGVRELKEEKSIADKNEDVKESQIAKTKEEADKLNGKEDYKTIPTFGKVDARQFTENYAKGSRLQDIKFTDDDIKNWREKGMLPKNAISVTARDYWRTSGRSQPSGYGNWAFKVGNETIFFGGRYSEAKAAIIEYARRKRIYSVDVLG